MLITKHHWPREVWDLPGPGPRLLCYLLGTTTITVQPHARLSRGVVGHFCLSHASAHSRTGRAGGCVPGGQGSLECL